MHPPHPIRLQDCWAKTDPATNKPALTVRDHSVIATAVAEQTLGKLSPASRPLAIEGSAALIGLHDIGKMLMLWVLRLILSP